MSRKIIITGTIAISLSFSLSAQEPMSLRECMDYALQHSSEKTILQADYDDALVGRRDAILQAFTPRISAGTNVYTNFGRTIDPETNSYISTTSFSNGYSVQASINLFNGFSVLNQIKIAGNAVKMGVSKEQMLEDKICLTVMEAYYNAVYRTEMIKALSAQVITARKHQLLVQNQYDLGQKGYADVVQAEADLAEREYQLLVAENEQNESLFDLKAVMLWSLADTLMIDSTIATEITENLSSCPTTEDSGIVSFAKTFQPSALLARKRMENAKYALRSARGQFLPSLTLSGGWSTSYYTYPGEHDYKAPSFASQFHNNGGEYVQLSLSIPIYDGLSRHSQLRRKKNDYRRATAEYRQNQQDIENDVNRALQDSRGAQKAYLQADRRFKVQEEAYRLNEKKFIQGLISPIEFQTVSNTYLSAKAERLNALLQYELKQSVVNFYNGISYLEQQKER